MTKHIIEKKLSSGYTARQPQVMHCTFAIFNHNAIYKC